MQDKKRSVTKKQGLSDETIKSLKKKLDFGRGLEIRIGSSIDEKNTKYSYFFSSKLPDLEINAVGAKRVLKVEVSSMENENMKLLHYLHSQIIKEMQ